MSPEVAKAHAATLQDWAQAWELDGVPDNGAAEVSYLMWRTARMINRFIGVAVPDEGVPAAGECVIQDEPRAG